ncbi:1-phosphofructokinase family hexose kinase [Polycladomyces subterraneus]|uniref:Tagatose-6-phosphate kinase n=1 Tax=Polycladomyces subterraneus TaxID=1016997 RepID=A0ABT8IMA5_9BACL|nr:1-phosphofructokinase family hexose kinase [Polycladomyces subterraneus]MDN4593877.1 1-phosphofructokinase family hexose kinase [Polycladomyces subterraneus]
MIYTVTLNTALDRILHIKGKIERKKNNRVCGIQYDIGGKGTHVSLVLSALKIPNIATGFVGKNKKDQFIQLLERKGVNCDFVVQNNATVRETLVLLDSTGEGSLMITEPGFQPTIESIQRLHQKLSQQVQPGDWVVFAGSPPEGFSPDDYRELLQCVKENGGRLVVDTSGPYLETAIQLRPYLIKPNEYEFQQMVGRTLSTVEEYTGEIEQLMAEGIKYVIVSLGERGSLVGHNGEVFQVIAPSIEARNDTGCGDVFVGGIVAMLSRKADLEEALCFATALSASKATHTSSSSFSLEQTRQLEKQVRIMRRESVCCTLKSVKTCAKSQG